MCFGRLCLVSVTVLEPPTLLSQRKFWLQGNGNCSNTYYYSLKLVFKVVYLFSCPVVALTHKITVTLKALISSNNLLYLKIKFGIIYCFSCWIKILVHFTPIAILFPTPHIFVFCYCHFGHRTTLIVIVIRTLAVIYMQFSINICLFSLLQFLLLLFRFWRGQHGPQWIDLRSLLRVCTQ